MSSSEGAMIPLTEAQCRSLRVLAALMIPADAGAGMPGADDDAIFADILASLGRDGPDVLAALDALDGMAGGRFGDLGPAEQEAAAARLQAEGGPMVLALTRAVVQCYYRDDRVVRAIGLEPRPPFPQGHVVEQGDWSLLDPVRERGPIWRQA